MGHRYFSAKKCNPGWQALESKEASSLRGHGPSYFRKLILAERGCRCEHCSKELIEKGPKGLHIHHKLKVRTHRHLRFERFNVMLVCPECHKVVELLST